MDKIYLELSKIRDGIAHGTNQDDVFVNARMCNGFMDVECHWRIDDYHVRRTFTYEQVCHQIENALELFIDEAIASYNEWWDNQ